MILMTKEFEKAYSAAIRLLGFRARSRSQMIDKLSEKGHDEKIIQAVMVILEDAGYINDIAYAKSFIESKRDRKFFGRRMITQQLSQKGVSKTDIDDAYSQLVDGDDERDAEQEAAIRALTKWLRTRDFDYQKAYAFLARRGYSTNVIKQAIASITEIKEEHHD